MVENSGKKTQKKYKKIQDKESKKICPTSILQSRCKLNKNSLILKFEASDCRTLWTWEVETHTVEIYGTLYAKNFICRFSWTISILQLFRHNSLLEVCAAAAQNSHMHKIHITSTRFAKNFANFK